MTIFRRVLLVLCALAALFGLVVVVVALSAHAGAKPREGTAAPMLQVPSGSASAGGVVVTAGPVRIDSLEVSVGEYETCVRAGACPFLDTAASIERTAGARGESAACAGGRKDAADAAINCVDYPAAEAFCRWAGKRLPTRDEWWVALAPDHETRWKTLHRTPLRSGWALSEWTSTAPVIPSRGEIAPLRYVASWSSEPERRNHGQVYLSSSAKVERSPQLSFRCVQ